MLFLNRYEYDPQINLIGKGNFSRVYKAIDRETGEPVAIKLYKSNPMYRRGILSSRAGELIGMEHPNINRYLAVEEVEKEDAFGEIEKIQICVMAFANGGNARDYYIRSKDLAWLKGMISDTIKAIDYLHQHNIIHKQIRPSNILIHETAIDASAKLTDYGIETTSDSTDNELSSALTVAIPYLAPEQLDPKKYGIDEKISPNIDFWLLGLTIYEIVTGEALFRRNKTESSEQVMKNIVDDSLSDRINELPEPFKTFVSSCLIKDAKNRPRNAGELAPLLDSTGQTRFTPVKDPGAEGEAAEAETQIILKPWKASVGDGDTPLKSEMQGDKITRDDTQVIGKVDFNEQPPDETVVLSDPSLNAQDDTKIISGSAQNAGVSVQDSLPNQNQGEGSITLFNRYEYLPITHLIGRGGFSRVYKAFDKKLSRWVALKIYKSNDLSERYSPFAEIKRVINLDNSNICRYLDIEEMENVNPFGETEKIQVCVMELLDSGNISEYYKLHPNPDILKKLLRDVLNGISYLHKKGIIHRDIKPANILIKESIEGPVAKITDFGISKLSDTVSNNSSSALIVSIPFMAPEQFNAKKYGVDEKISFNLDLWSLGVTIYEVYTGSVLFKDNEQDNSEQIMANIMAPALPEKIKFLPQPFKDIVSRCLVKNANQRAQTAEELLTLLNRKASDDSSVTPVKLNPTVDVGDVSKSFEQVTEGRGSAHSPSPEVKEDVEDVQKSASPGKSKLFSFAPSLDEAPIKITAKRIKNKKVWLVSGGVFLLFFYFLFMKKFASDNSITSVEMGKDTITKQKAVAPKDTALNKLVQPPGNDSPAHTDIALEEKSEAEIKGSKQSNTKKQTLKDKSNTGKMLVELTTVEECKIVWNGKPYADLAPGSTLTTHIAPGQYTLEATSLGSNKVYSRLINVKPADIKSGARLSFKIVFR